MKSSTRGKKRQSLVSPDQADLWQWAENRSSAPLEKSENPRAALGLAKAIGWCQEILQGKNEAQKMGEEKTLT